jgi:hypothetical protein
MSPETDPVTVPTNGKHRASRSEVVARPPTDLPPPLAVTPFTPTQLAVGFGILAAVITLVVGNLVRRGRSGRRGPFGRR